MINIILFGPPGSGKGTQAKKLAEHYGFIHISTGDLFRYELGNNTELGQLARSYMDKGDLVPDEVTTQMLANKLEDVPYAPGIIYDGYPRNVNQVQSLESLLDSDDQEVSCLLSLNVPDDEIVKRILERGKSSGRKDDQNEATIRKRIEIYKKETEPVYSYFDVQDRAALIDGSGSIEEVFGNLCEVIDFFVDDNQDS